MAVPSGPARRGSDVGPLTDRVDGVAGTLTLKRRADFNPVPRPPSPPSRKPPPSTALGPAALATGTHTLSQETPPSSSKPLRRRLVSE